MAEHPKSSIPPSLQHLEFESRAPGGKGGRGVPPAQRLVCSPRASTRLGCASGYGCHIITAMRVIRSQDPAGSADADINININEWISHQFLSFGHVR